VLEAENESLKEFVKTSASQEHQARKELHEKHARDLAELNEKLEKSQGRTVTMISKNKALEAEAEAIDKLIFRKRFPCCCSNYPASFISNGNCFPLPQRALASNGQKIQTFRGRRRTMKRAYQSTSYLKPVAESPRLCL
jgi:hypothetical protein